MDNKQITLNKNNIFGEVDRIRCRKRYRSVDILSYLTTSAEYLYSEAEPHCGSNLKEAILDTRTFLRKTDVYGTAINLIFNDRRLTIDTTSRVEDVLYEYYHYDEIYGTAPEHLK